MKEQETLDGRDRDEWLTWLQTQEDLHRVFTAPDPSRDRWPTLLAIGLGDALDAVERVAAWAQRGKHPGPKWASQTVDHQAGKLVRHLGAGLVGETRDEDTSEHPFAHVAARSLMLLGLALKAAK